MITREEVYTRTHTHTLSLSLSLSENATTARTVINTLPDIEYVEVRLAAGHICVENDRALCRREPQRLHLASALVSDLLLLHAAGIARELNALIWRVNHHDIRAASVDRNLAGTSRCGHHPEVQQCLATTSVYHCKLLVIVVQRRYPALNNPIPTAPLDRRHSRRRHHCRTAASGVPSAPICIHLLHRRRDHHCFPCRRRCHRRCRRTIRNLRIAGAAPTGIRGPSHMCTISWCRWIRGCPLCGTHSGIHHNTPFKIPFRSERFREIEIYQKYLRSVVCMYVLYIIYSSLV